MARQMEQSDVIRSEKEKLTPEEIDEEERAYFEAFGFVLIGEGEETELVEV